MDFFSRVDSPLRLARGLARHGLHRLGLRSDARVWHRGLPPGLDPELYDSIAADAVGDPVKGASYVHLSPFKAIGGAYRIRARTSAGVSWSVCFKECLYDRDSVPGLVNHPARLGWPEHAVYSRSTGDLRRLLPKVLHAEEVAAGLHYRYLLEDVFPRYRKPVSSDGIIRATSALCTLHTATARWVSEGADDGLIRYDRRYMQQLACHAARALDEYEHAGLMEPTVSATVLADLLACLSTADFLDATLPVVIHGDYNRASVLLDSGSRDGFRVIDWEWAGVGPAHLDLARLLETSDSAVIHSALERFAEEHPRVSLREHTRLFHWARIVTAVSSAAIIVADMTAGGAAPMIDRAEYVRESLQRAIASHAELVSGPL